MDDTNNPPTQLPTENDCTTAGHSESWNAYHEAMTEIVDKMTSFRKAIKKVTPEEIESVRDYLLLEEPQSTLPIATGSDSTESFRQILSSRRQAFLEQTNFNPHQYALAMQCICNLVSSCAKNKTPLPIVPAWSKIKNGGMILKPNVLSSFLFVIGLNDDLADLSLEVATCHDLLYGAAESSVHLRIKSLVALNDTKSAEALIEELPDDGQECKRLRTFTPLLTHYCKVGDTSSVLRLWQLIRAAPRAYMDGETYSLILGALARNRVFGLHSPIIDDAVNLGLSADTGPKLLDEILLGMGEDVLEVSDATALDMYNHFRAGFKLLGDFLNDRREIPYAANAVDGWELTSEGVQFCVGRVNVDPISSVCPATGAKLRLNTLSDSQRQHMRNALFEMAEAQHVEFTAGRKKSSKNKSSGDDAKKELIKFGDWLENREGDPFTAFVDGANVAYFGQGTVRYSQVQKVVAELERLGENPLVIMPRKYVNSSFRRAQGAYQQLKPADLDVITRLINEQKMYVVPAHYFDDYYWMLASIANQNGMKTSSQSSILPGIRPILISNDQMRDHKLEMLEPQLFRRWFSSHIVTYAIAPFIEDEWEDRKINFAAADSFSCEIQGNAINREGMEGTAWHIPVSEWQPRTSRLCIAVATLKK
ncbi:expressed unknown protein [Seminavis robusta]|uniref:ribonuclease P n=1 Tax=Seminavis robusta TaxID=568900 RepID=A0A9N8H5G4_9STRA|nr:expressed unknown protein [Seminavis robusta]|eukprot:Sro23_g015820.1 n/a (650) ;mRNA; r:79455-81736